MREARGRRSQALRHREEGGHQVEAISPGGVGEGFFDDFAWAFDGKKGNALLATLRSERFLLSPNEVVDASGVLSAVELDDDDEDHGVFASELVQSFAAAVKKRQGVRGRWG